MSGTPGADVVAELLGAWRRAFDGHRVADIVSLFSEDALFQGIGPDLRTGPEEIAEYYAVVPEGTRAEVEVLGGIRLGEGTVGGFADVTFTARTGETHPVRLSIVAERARDGWLIRQYHAATRR
ncbi:nuclear transport factor 2 family protein [Streptosporangium sp. NBC_01756]|uniref:nuclear transport factor 2 family protein n=1 Tax=Streptosporangium sp. NBC_01756 TaxID=2975950 RepID=UPI002DD90018|nr:nuclear transport factor 2 family protein [Streptosporangium sp. NBC_01756]WSC85627.1 nuclear transport factor 2 family protein [Streptosporangium sp. NBC_01756]